MAGREFINKEKKIPIIIAIIKIPEQKSTMLNILSPFITKFTLCLGEEEREEGMLPPPKHRDLFILMELH